MAVFTRQASLCRIEAVFDRPGRLRTDDGPPGTYQEIPESLTLPIEAPILSAEKEKPVMTVRVSVHVLS